MSVVLALGFFSLALRQARPAGGWHGRDRGGDRGCLYLMMPGDLVEGVVEACKWGRGGEKEKLGRGVLRLMGAWSEADE